MKRNALRTTVLALSGLLALGACAGGGDAGDTAAGTSGADTGMTGTGGIGTDTARMGDTLRDTLSDTTRRDTTP